MLLNGGRNPVDERNQGTRVGAVRVVESLAVFTLAVIEIVGLRQRNYLQVGVAVVFFRKNIQNLIEDNFINLFIGQTKLIGNSLAVAQREIFRVAFIIFARGAEDG